MRLQNGTGVQTVKPEREATDWTAGARLSRRWGVRGHVVAHHDSHGLTYEVRHPDGTIGHYEPHELQVVDVPARTGLHVEVVSGQVELNYVDIVVKTKDVVVLHIECRTKHAFAMPGEEGHTFEFTRTVDSSLEDAPTIVRLVGLLGDWRPVFSEGEYSQLIALVNVETVRASTHSSKPHAWMRKPEV